MPAASSRFLVPRRPQKVNLKTTVSDVFTKLILGPKRDKAFQHRAVTCLIVVKSLKLVRPPLT